MLCYITCHVLLYDVSSYITCVMLCYITYVMSCYITCHVTLYNICHVLLYNMCHVMSCYVLLKTESLDNAILEL